MNLSRVGITLAVAVFGAAAAGMANAATDGNLGATSQGTLTISLTIDPLVQISDLDDITLPTFTGTGPVSGSDDVCVYSNNGGFDITATGSGASSAFTLAGTGTNTIPYSVAWANSSGATSGTSMSTSVPLDNQVATFTGGADCGGGTNTTVLVTVGAADLNVAPTDTYAGILTLMVAPQ
jgi:hypothetical protein